MTKERFVRTQEVSDDVAVAIYDRRLRVYRQLTQEDFDCLMDILVDKAIEDTRFELEDDIAEIMASPLTEAEIEKALVFGETC